MPDIDAGGSGSYKANWTQDWSLDGSNDQVDDVFEFVCADYRCCHNGEPPDCCALKVVLHCGEVHQLIIVEGSSSPDLG